MRWEDGFIAVDWGTSNRRAYRIDADGTCAAEFEDSGGVLSIETRDFPTQANDIRKRLGDLPLLLAGMVGSTRGWVEAPYAPCPADLDDLAARLCWIESGRTAIVPGLSLNGTGHCDVMRGEEIQLFGAIASGLIPPTTLVCHPGTHNKWVTVDQGKIMGFRTVMTGEMFNLLRSQGILAEFLSRDVSLGDAFREGVRRGLQRPVLTADLFTVRARVLLGSLARDDASAYTSGLLVGLDISVGLELARGSNFIVMGRPELTRLYAAAAAEAGRTCQVVDGADAFLAGALALGSKLT
ncbi:MAG: 2-dehydro-3-deoxygalactonokinase [Sphingomonas sp.]|nr:2-dehydro-3-deoxygalactonokinase [Sphingomonas sp.]